MSREIKFRVFVGSTMITIDPSSNFTLEFGNDNPILHMFSNGGESLGEHGEFKDFELMQYTGIKDRNGVEIYEGDIVKCGLNDVAEPVFFDDGAFVTKSSCIFPSMLVIGNIHQNPELLESQK